MKRTNMALKTNISLLLLCLFQFGFIEASAQIDSLGRNDTLRNQVGIIRLQSFYDNHKKSTSITSLEYSHRLENKSTIIGRLNYSDRDVVRGFQLEAESYLIHSPKYYSFVSVSAANNDAFPKFKAAYSLNRNFNKGWEGELGYRYLRAEGMDIHSSIWGVGKYLGNYWLNLKGYLIFDDGNIYQSYRFTSRYYVNDKLDYLTLILSTGTSPDDRNRNFDYSNFGDFISKSVALGYKKSFKNNFSSSFVTSWNNFKISDTKHLNQVDFYLTLSKQF